LTIALTSNVYTEKWAQFDSRRSTRTATLCLSLVPLRKGVESSRVSNSRVRSAVEGPAFRRWVIGRGSIYMYNATLLLFSGQFTLLEKIMA
jgi:hypothetical protein